MTEDELTEMCWEITQILYKCDTQGEAFNLMIATLGAFIVNQYKYDIKNQIKALKFVRNNLDDFIGNVEKGNIL